MFILCTGLFWACSEDELPLEDLIAESADEGDNSDPGDNEEEPPPSDDAPADDPPADDPDGNCEPQNFIFNEANGYVLAEMEDASFGDSWQLSDSEPNFSGQGYLVWTGQQYLGNPGNGLVTYKINISNPGTYQFAWHSAVTNGDNGTEHNDSWLRFPDASDFFAERDNSIVYPKGSGKTPNPEGGGADGWFKIYRSGNDLGFKWQAYTYDNNPHTIFVTFNTAGEYTMEVSARSSAHAIDKFVLFQEGMSLGDVTGEGSTFTEIGCSN